MPYILTNPPENFSAKKETNNNLAPDPRSSTGTTDSVEPSIPERSIARYPLVTLQADSITDTAAARLASSLLGHVLFLKNQIPLPIIQLSRMPCTETSARAAKQRAELLTSFDTISSHLDTTFTALSTAFARCSNIDTPKAHLAILVGPSLTLAKAKVMLGIDGLEANVWGSEESQPNRVQSDDGSEDEKSDEKSESSGDESGEGDVPEDSADGESEDEDEESEEDQSEEDSENENVNGEDVAGLHDKHNSGDQPTTNPPLYRSYAEEQKFLQNADRLLSRTLAAADADGHGILSDMAPTQTHILLHAPRRFNHPAWIPRQNITNSLDNALQEFMINSGLRAKNTDIPKHSKNNPVEGVWITTRAGLRPTLPSLQKDEDPKKLEDDEMIWWSWDGKFVGFSDW
ncbi:hypothetical protein CPC08DRAFT_692193 [Agrocybe pediades]|nr:hypothetical protein CPC08DRAFT_692193 [Agrocybe pediades]